MSQQDKLKNFVLEQFSDIVDQYSFSTPAIGEEKAMTRIDYLGTNLAIELELDWREFDIYVLIVRLEDGKLPKGYYVSNGKKCRKHFVNIVREQGWSLGNFKISKKIRREENDFKQDLVAHKALLLSHMNELLDTGESLFA